METLLHWPPGADVPGSPGFRARRFGSRAFHLDVEPDPAGAGRARAVTAVLAACLADPEGHPLEPAVVREATVAWRLQGLIAVAAATRGLRLGAEAECPAEDCREQLELDLDLRDFAAAEAPGRVEWRQGEAALTLRLPTGKDQEIWSSDPRADFAAMASSLVVAVGGEPRPDAWRLPEPWLEGISGRLGEADPLTDLRLRADCPACGREADLELDLEALLLGCLARERKALVRDIHRLALAYHWSEEQILALSPARRAHYLSLLEEGR